MGRGTSKLGNSGSKSGISSDDYRWMNMSDLINRFYSAVPRGSVLDTAFQDYASGVFGGAQKSSFDEANALSDFIDSRAADPLRITGNPTLYRGGTISDEQFQSLQVGKPLTIMDSQDQLTSWSNREVTAHMYAENSKTVWGQGGANSHDVIIVDTSKSNDGIAVPHTWPQGEILRSKSHAYTITKIVNESEYKRPIGRENEPEESRYDYYTKPVTYIYVKST